MNKNLVWKLVFVLILVGVAAVTVYPPQYKLKPGLDLAGGTSLVYDISAADLEAGERKGLAQRMIPILRRRIDPTNVANIVMRPQGDTRIEIQLPVASQDTLDKREAYEDALTALQNTNLNLLRLKRALTADTQEREEVFAEFSGDDQQRRAILDDLAQAYQELMKARDARDKLYEKMQSLQKKFEQAGLNEEVIEEKVFEWAKMEEAARNEAIGTFVEEYAPTKEGLLESLANFGKPAAKDLLTQYVEVYSEWAEVANSLADPEDGKQVRYNEAAQNLSDLNLNITQLTEVLDMSADSPERERMLQEFRERFPDRADKINAVVATYDEYSKVGGRLDDPEDLKRMLRGSGVLEFRILPTIGNGISQSEAIAFQQSLQEQGPKLSSTDRFKWFEIENPEEWKAGGVVTGVFGDKLYVLASDDPKEVMLQDGSKDWKLEKAFRTTDYNTGREVIGFTHDVVAANLFQNLTKNNIGRPLCILLDDLAISAPNIEEAISQSGIIRGDYTQTELDDMINKLNAGSFPARLSEVPISEKSIGPALGADNRDQGIRAGLIGLGVVAIFMIAYYLLPGFIADLALLMNIVFVLAMMVIFQATFTLPGIAGIILTIGMSVDANVLIFERIREEQERGSSLRTAIANGYGRAFRTIFDANVTTFITAFILYWVASEEIKGFAIVLMLGIAASMFTALFVTRVIFDLLVDGRVIRDHLVMLRLFRTVPTINWMGMRNVFLVFSALIVAGGLTVFFTRDEAKNSKYDIEFTGGTSVQISLKEGADFTRNDIEKMFMDEASKYDIPALSAAKVYAVGDDGLNYEITTTETNKTTATVTFETAAPTVEEAGQAIRKTADKLGRTMYNLAVAKKGNNQLAISTSQVNKGFVSEVLQQAFGEQAQVSEPQINEVVSNIVRDAFAGYLNVREDLGATITSVEPVTEADVEIGNFIGGIQIHVKLDSPVEGEELRDRFKDIRFKPDAQDLSWYQYELLDEKLQVLEDDETLDRFVFVSVHPEAGYRELSEDEEQRFEQNETRKIQQATSLETTLTRVTQIDPSIGKQSQTQALIAIILSLIAIVGYVWIRFGNARYGFAAIAALVHDVCITLGAVTACTYLAGTPVGRALGIGDFKISLEMIAAFLTIIGYSLNDTIVVFDRIRENRGKLATVNPGLLSQSINQTLSRTLLTSFTTFLVVFVMYIWGGTGLRGFTFAMLVGIVIGTYSSIAIAAPILLLGHKATSALKSGK